jgi:hypothetical protein
MTTPEKRDRIFLLYGKAAFQAQLLEEELVQTLADQRWTGDTMPAKVIEDAEHGLGKLPLGPLGKKFREEFPGFTHFANYLDLVREKRNYLAHRFFRDCHFEIEWGSTYEPEQRDLESILVELEQCKVGVAKLRKSVAEWKSGQSAKHA